MNSAKELSSDIRADLGQVNLSLAALESIAAKAASEVRGVATTKSKLQKEAGSFLGMDRDRIKSNVNNESGEIVIDMFISVRFGYKVPEVALSVQDRVKEQILFMTDIHVSQVNVHIEAIETENLLTIFDRDGE